MEWKQVINQVYVIITINMKKLIILFLLISNLAAAQGIKKLFKFSTFYVAANGGTSLSDVDVFSVNNGLSTQTVETH